MIKSKSRRRCDILANSVIKFRVEGRSRMNNNNTRTLLQQLEQQQGEDIVEEKKKV